MQSCSKLKGHRIQVMSQKKTNKKYGTVSQEVAQKPVVVEVLKAEDVE